MLARRLLFCVALVSSVAFGTPDPAASADQAAQGDVADLRTQLKSGLKCRRDVEFAFVELVAQMVDSGQLSVELVKGTFQWARRKRPYPFPYFERAMRERAAAAGVVIP
jgi:hypothetical protein